MKSAFENNFFSTNKTLNLHGRIIDLRAPRIMGILNVTPDSFYDGGKHQSPDEILKHVEKMLHDGATFIDVGGYSTRPGAEDISPEEELGRVLPVIRSIQKNFPEACVSIDTFRSEVAAAALQEGASLINDVTGGQGDPAMIEVAARLQVPYILMHMRGNPKSMQKMTEYTNLVKEIADYFHAKIDALQNLGVKDILLDPGFGFSKDTQQNFELLNKLDYFAAFGKPLLVGLSRKSMIWRTLSGNSDEALNGTTAVNTIALMKGASILRVHDVKEAAEVVKLVAATRFAESR
jgi:dihydropteroate synthase